jgi:hypothetical protein
MRAHLSIVHGGVRRNAGGLRPVSLAETGPECPFGIPQGHPDYGVAFGLSVLCGTPRLHVGCVGPRGTAASGEIAIQMRIGACTCLAIQARAKRRSVNQASAFPYRASKRAHARSAAGSL